MADYRLDELTAGLLLSDQPLGYTPPRGPRVPLGLVYYHRESLQPQIFTFSNLGPKWTFGWTRFVQEVPTDGLGITPPHVSVSLPPSREVFSAPDAQGVYPAHWNSRSVLVHVSDAPVRYERRLPDGTVEVYTLSDGAPAGQRRIMLAQITDPQGQSVQLTWDSQTRLVAITDAIGQVTTLAYEHATDPLKITKITDPFGRFATFTYNTAGQLASITDVIGLTSRFAYGPDDFVSSLTTPYGVTTFRHEPNAANTLNVRFIEATDPLGGTEHLEFQWETPSLSASLPATDVPTGFTGWNWNLDHYNTFYWNKRAWAAGANDLLKAQITHWLVKAEWQGWQKYSFVPHSVKKPLEARVWFAYPGQVAGSEDELGWSRRPSRVGRVLEAATSQIDETTYNTQGNVLTATDPLGRQASYTYASNGVDLLQVSQTTGGMSDLLATYQNYNAQHRPASVTDAAGQSTSITYNAAGQPLTVTNAKNETTTSTYDTDGRLVTVTGPLSGATTTYTYDVYSRIHTVTDADGYVVTTDYDLFDRPTRVSYPDGTYEETSYERLDVATRRDRLGRVTRYQYDALRRLIATRDPLGRVITQQWCGCGSLDGLVDGNGRRIQWERDLEGRVTREVRADGITATTYTYGPASGRVATITDPKEQVSTFTYALDNSILSTVYSNAQVSTASVTYSYDAQYGRLETMTDGTGMTSYAYHQAGALGAGQVASVDGPLTHDTITYTYDQLGRVTTRAIDGVGVTWTFDALGRLTNEANVLGTFTYSYDGATARIASVTYPNQQTSTYSYFGNSGDRRPQTIHHKYPNGETLSRFDYTYDAVGNILTWRQQAGPTAVSWEYGYDQADQLTWAIEKTADSPFSVLKLFNYAYDPAGNRTSEQIDDQLMGATYDNLNRLVARQPTGVITVEGTVSEPSAVTVQGKPAVVAPNGRFTAPSALTGSTTTLTIAATDSSGNTATALYEVDSTGSNQSLTYDANGNLTGDGLHSFDRDARQELTFIATAGQSMTITYDGLRHRKKLHQTFGGGGSADTDIIWCGELPCQQSTTSGNLTRFFQDGVQTNGLSQYVVRDHLGSVAAVTNASAEIVARYSYDPFGRATQSEGTGQAPFPIGFAGYVQDSLSGLSLTSYREYDPAIGRWLSEDPIRLDAGPNMYAYVNSNPVRLLDPLGLKCVKKRMLVTAYCDKGPGSDWSYYKPKKPGGSPGSVGPGSIAVANTNPKPYCYGSTFEVYDDKDKITYTGEAHDTGAGWDKKHHDVSPDQWIDIWLPCKDAKKWGKQYRNVTVCDACDIDKRCGIM
jgi:RHS repeat-associated protein